MDIHDFLKSAADDDQMEMMLMQMDKLPDFSGAYDDVNEINAMMEFSNQNEDSDDSNMNNHPMLKNDNTFFENFHVNSPTFMNPHPFSGGVHQDSPFPPQQPNSGGGGRWESGEFSGQAEKLNSMAAMREMIFRIAAMQPVHIDPEAVKPPKRKNVKISTDPQSVAARHRRERISERIRILQRLVPGGTKMDTASMLDEAIHYVKFLKNQVQSLERVAAHRPEAAGVGFPVPMSSGSYFPVAAGKGYHPYPPPHHNVQHLTDA